MGYKSKRFQVTRVSLPDGYWADVAPLTKDEADECQQALMGGLIETQVGAGAGLTKAKLHQRDYTDLVLLRAIKAWNLDDEDGNPLPITLDAIHALTGKDSDLILGVVQGVTSPLAIVNGKVDSA